MTYFFDTPRVVKPGLEVAPVERGVMMLVAVPGSDIPVGVELTTDQSAALIAAVTSALRDAADGPSVAAAIS